MMSGEMGRSIFGHPLSYLKLMGKYRGSLAERKAAGSLKMGVALHWNKVCGNCFWMPPVKTQARVLCVCEPAVGVVPCAPRPAVAAVAARATRSSPAGRTHTRPPSPPDPSPPPQAEYNATYHATFTAQKNSILPRFDVPMIRRVFEVSDVLGISHYAPAPTRDVDPGDFNSPIDTAAFELGHWGIDLKVRVRVWGGGGWEGRLRALAPARLHLPLPTSPAEPPPPPLTPPNTQGLINSKRDFLFSEVGLGGADPNNQRVATNLAELATNVHNGIWAVYNVAQDPWRNQVRGEGMLQGRNTACWVCAQVCVGARACVCLLRVPQLIHPSSHTPFTPPLPRPASRTTRSSGASGSRR